MPIVFGADVPRLVNQLWLPVLLPLAAGALAIYWLLPRPRRYPAVWGAGAGLAALTLAGLFTVRAGGPTPETVLFYAFSGISIVAAAMLVTQQNPARAALSFTLVVLSTCGLFLLLAAPFLMAATIIIYAGAIVVTFLFVLMLAQQEGQSDADSRSREPLLATLTGFVLLGALLYVLSGDELRYDRILARVDQISSEPALAELREWRSKEGVSREREAAFEAAERPFNEARDVLRASGYEDLAREVEAAIPTWASLGDRPLEDYRAEAGKLRALVEEGRKRHRLGVKPVPADGRPPLAALSSYSGTPANAPLGEVRRDPKTGLPAMPADNPAFLGRSLFTDYLLPVELGGTLLLVATVGAIAIAQRRQAQAGRRNGAPAPGRTA